MAIKRYTASKDNTISNAFSSDLITRGTGSNMGASDILEVFSIYGQASSSSIERSRALLEFPVSTISSDRSAGTIPASGSVDFFLKVYNAEHPFTVPRDFTLAILAVSQSWQEGRGLDMDQYNDDGYCNWIHAASASSGITNWGQEGGTFHSGAYSAGDNLPLYTYDINEGPEDIELNITSMVEEWLAGPGGEGPLARDNYGLVIKVSGTQEDGSEERSYYTKKFFGRGSEFFYKRPSIEARWDDTKQDDSNNFYLSSSLADASDNLNTLYIYNYVRGQLKDIPTVGTTKMLMSIHSASLTGTMVGSTPALSLPPGAGVRMDGDTFVTASHVSTGVYSASFAFASSSVKTVYPVWYTGSSHVPATLPSDSILFHTGSAITVKALAASSYNPNPKYFTNITNLKSKYSNDENARFRVYVRQKDWSPTIYTKAKATIETEIIDSGFYKVVRAIDELEVIPFGTGTIPYTKMSYDASGSYFDLDMELLEAGYAYQIYLAYYINGAYHEQPELFKFRVE